jgi:hypothetical protein
MQVDPRWRELSSTCSARILVSGPRTAQGGSCSISELGGLRAGWPALRAQHGWPHANAMRARVARVLGARRLLQRTLRVAAAAHPRAATCTCASCPEACWPRGEMIASAEGCSRRGLLLRSRPPLHLCSGWQPQQTALPPAGPRALLQALCRPRRRSAMRRRRVRMRLPAAHARARRRVRARRAPGAVSGGRHALAAQSAGA